MREIKFRAWVKCKYLKHNKRVYTNKYLMMYGDKLKVNGSEEYHDLIFEQTPLLTKEQSKEIESNFSFDETKAILMQFTGLKDKNGKEIFEGDIVDWSTKDKKLIYEITFCNGSFGLDLTNRSGFELHNINYFELEIIGNKFENPELLK